MKRAMLALLILAMVVGFAAAGGSGEKKEGAAATTMAPAGGLPIVKDKLTLKMLTNDWAGIVVGNDMPVYKEMEKRTNIHLEFSLLPVQGTVDKLNLIMASGDLPDIIGYGDAATFNKYGMQGALIALQDLINKYGPDVKKAIENPLPGDPLPYKLNGWAELTAADGNVYTVPNISSTNAIGPVFGIRTDWLEKLGLKVPDTTDDLYNVLKAFKDKDPNGNGKADEIPFVQSHGATNGSNVIPIINAFGAHMGLYLAKDGTIKYGPTEQKYKDGLAYLAKLYKDGLLDVDYLTTTRDQWLAKTTGNVAGYQYAWPGSGFATPNAGLQKLDPKFKLYPIPPVKGPNGDRYKDTQSAGRYIGYRNAITAKNKNPETTMKYLNYCFQPDGLRLIEWGIEGVHYTMVNGKPKYTEYVTKNPKGLDPELARIQDGVDATCLPYMLGWASAFDAMANTAPWSVRAWELYREPGMVESPFPTLQYKADELASFNQFNTEISNTYVPEMANKFIMGIEPLSKFDDFVAQLQKMKVDEWLKIVNAAYGRYGKGK
jgi:putative aldouronate transport system substrate-binding protein